MKSIAFIFTSLVFCCFLGSNAFAKGVSEMNLDPENLIELKNQYLQDLLALENSSKEAQVELAKFTDKDFTETILAGHRRQRRYYPPAYPVYPPQYQQVVPFLYTCFYQNNWGWVYNGTARTLPEADYLARFSCLQSSPFCAPAGCRY